MTRQMNRRQWLAGAATLASTCSFGLPALADLGAPRRLSIESANLDVNGRSAKVFRLVDDSGRPGLTLAPGERFRVMLQNRINVPSIVHWHGQTPPWTQDGFPWPQTPALAPGEAASYDFEPIAGTYWMHSHEGLQEQSLMTAPLVVQDAGASQADRQEVVLMLHDFSFRPAQELLADLTGVDGGREDETENAPAPGLDMASMRMSGMSPSDMLLKSQTSKPMAGMKAQPATKMDLNDIDYDAFLANDKTLRDPEIVRVAAGAAVRLRVINGSSSSQFWIDLGALEGLVAAVDGHDVKAISASLFPLAIAQRLDILINLPGPGAFPILACLEGSRRRTGVVLATAGAAVPHLAEEADRLARPVDNSLEDRLSALDPLSPRRPDVSARVVLSGGMKPYRWAMNTEHWPEITPLMVKHGQRVEIELVNSSMMAHPMHLHGHTFQVIGLNGRVLGGARRDTILVPPMGSARIAFDADNPGRWAFHCHNLYHMAAGMMSELRYEGIPV